MQKEDSGKMLKMYKKSFNGVNLLSFAYTVHAAFASNATVPEALSMAIIDPRGGNRGDIILLYTHLKFTAYFYLIFYYRLTS